jgi:hypothetical protein
VPIEPAHKLARHPRIGQVPVGQLWSAGPGREHFVQGQPLGENAVVRASWDLCLYARTAASSMFEGKEVVMRLIRKLTYLATRGMIDIRSDAERIASYSKNLLNEKTDTRRAALH